MAERRMFAKSVVDSDAFLELSLSAQALYLHLGVAADDDGFLNSARTIQRMTGASEADMNELLQKGFVILFESGVIALTHWGMNNSIRKDRYKPTVFASERAALKETDSGIYQPDDNQVTTSCQPDDNQATTQYRIVKVRLDKVNNIGRRAPSTQHTTSRSEFVPPTVEEVRAYCISRGSCIDPEAFIDHYASQKWKKANGRQITDWKASLRTWEKNEKEKAAKPPNSFHNFAERTNSGLNELMFRKQQGHG